MSALATGSAITEGAACGGASIGPADAGPDAGGDTGSTEPAPDGFDGFDAGEPMEVGAGGPDVGPIPDAGCLLNVCPGQCLLGRCLTVLYTGDQTGAGGVAVLGTTVYWAVPGTSPGSGKILSHPIATLGPASSWAVGLTNPQGVALSAQSLFWADDSVSAGGVFTEPFSLGALTDGGVDAATDGATPDAMSRYHSIGSSTGYVSPSSVATDATYVYWTVAGATTTFTDATLAPSGLVLAEPLGGGDVITLASGRSGPTSMAVDATSVYWVESGLQGVPDGRILKIAKPGMAGDARASDAGGGQPTTLAVGQNYPTSIAVGGGYVFWAEATVEVDDAAGSAGAAAIVSIPVSAVVTADGGTTVRPTTLKGGLEIIGGVTADATSVYWTVGGGNGTGFVESAPVGGGTVVTLADNLDSPGAMAVDATSLYWGDTLTGSLRSLTPK